MCFQQSRGCFTSLLRMISQFWDHTKSLKHFMRDPKRIPLPVLLSCKCFTTAQVKKVKLKYFSQEFPADTSLDENGKGLTAMSFSPSSFFQVSLTLFTSVFFFTPSVSPLPPHRSPWRKRRMRKKRSSSACFPSSTSSSGSETRSWSAAPWGRARARSQSAAAAWGTGWSGTPSLARASGSACTSAARASRGCRRSLREEHTKLHFNKVTMENTETIKKI